MGKVLAESVEGSEDNPRIDILPDGELTKLPMIAGRETVTGDRRSPDTLDYTVLFNILPPPSSSAF